MIWLLIVQGVLILLMGFALLAMYDHIKMFKFLVENFVTTVQKLCDNATRENKNVGANIGMLKEAIKDANKITNCIKNFDVISGDLSSTEKILKSEVARLKKGN